MKESFTAVVKNELMHKDREERATFLAFCYGLFTFSSSFSAEQMYIKTENEAIAKTYLACAKRLCAAEGLAVVKKGKSYYCEIPGERDRLRVLSAFSLTGKEPKKRINLANIDSEDCYPDFLAGAFCACGMIADPYKDYHLEFSVSYHQLSKDLLNLMRDIDLEPVLTPRYMVRNYDIVIYYKGSEHIEDLLVFMGAQNAAFRLMDIKIEKELRNRANRVRNCDAANLDKVTKAGVQQAQAVKRIQKTIGIEALPQELQEIARLRLANPEMSLSQLTDSLQEPLSRSGVNHRLKKLEKIAEAL